MMELYSGGIMCLIMGFLINRPFLKHTLQFYLLQHSAPKSLDTPDNGG